MEYHIDLGKALLYYLYSYHTTKFDDVLERSELTMACLCLCVSDGFSNFETVKVVYEIGCLWLFRIHVKFYMKLIFSVSPSLHK